MKKSGTVRVLRTALLSRLLLLTLICTWRSLFHPYDTSASLNPPCLSSPSPLPPPPLFPRLGSAIERSVVWDSVYFVRIAECGYEYEQTYAFFPILPICMSLLARTVFAPFVPVLGYRAVLALSGYVLSNAAFVAAAVFLYSVVWDSVYFVRIAECGYEYEQTYAFFPILPICMSLLARTVFAPFVPVLGDRAVLALSGYVLINATFVVAVVFLYRLSLLVLNDTSAAMQSSILFCFNPASIFYSSIYSESLYALFAFGGLYYFFLGSSTLATFLLALSGSARSNGMLNAGYLCFQAIHQAYRFIIQKKSPILAMQGIFVGIMRSMCILLPFVSFQAYGYFNICSNRTMDQLRPWCKKRPPRLYDYIQGHYWGVGFLRYFEVKQLPNFFLASPILSITIFSIYTYAKIRPDIVFSLGLRAPFEENRLMDKPHFCGIRSSVAASSDIKEVMSSISRDSSTHRQRKNKGNSLGSSSQEIVIQKHQGYSSILLLPFIYHLAFLSLTAFFIMHVQVATRFLSSSPPVYWFAAYLFASSRRSSYLIWAYSYAYILMGSLLFSNFYPFT